MKNTPIENRTTWSQTIYAPIVLLALTLILPPQAMSQTVMPRNAAAPALFDAVGAVNESAISVGANSAMTVYHFRSTQSGDPAVEMAYAFAQQQPDGSFLWIDEGIINHGAIGGQGLSDPSVAYNTSSGDYIVCALTLDDPRQVVVSKYKSDSGEFQPWQILGGGFGDDKPWIVAGAMPVAQGNAPLSMREFYVTWKHGQDGTLEYRRSTDGGVTWIGGAALFNVNDPGSLVGFGSVPAPRVHTNRPLYVLYHGDAGVGMRIVRGDDIGSGPHAGEVQFTQLLDSSGQPLEIDLNQGLGPALYYLAPPQSSIIGPRGWGIDLAVDPSDPNRLYVVYNDTPFVLPLSADLNIYLRVLTKISGATWSVGPPILVNNNISPFESDQLLPSIKVDSTGRVHVIFYDDRNFNVDSDQPDTAATPKYDVYYAWAPGNDLDFGPTERNRNLCDNPEQNCVGTEPAVDYAVTPITGFVMGDYIGIDVRGSRVWTSFMGMSMAQPNDDKDRTLVWSSEIEW